MNRAGQMPSFPQRTRIESADFVVASIRSLGFDPPPESRIMQMHRVLTTTVGLVAPETNTFEIALEALRDLQILAFIFDVSNVADDGFKQLVKTVLKDSVFPQDAKTHSKGRDAQFELYVAAICQNAGMTPVTLEEPDVVCHIGGREFGIAAKRPKSIKSFQQNIKKAGQQIMRSGIAGFIAVETSLAMNSSNERITTPIPDDEYYERWVEAMNRFTDAYIPRFRMWLQGKNLVRGVFLHDHQVRLASNRSWSLDGMTFKIRLFVDDQDCSMFAHRYIGGLKNLQS